MWDRMIAYFAERHLVTNFIFLAVFVGGIVAWQNTSKEEYPDITFDTVRISVSYPGAPAQDVEYFVTKPIEEEVRGLDGVYRVTSNSSVGSSNVSVELEQDYDKVDEAIMEIRNAVMDVELPIEVINDPRIRVFKTSKKAIIDVALYHTDYPILTREGRRELQQYVLALENQLINLPQIHSVNKDGYLQEEIQIRADPDKLLRYEIPFNTVMREIRDNHVRKPAGTIETDKEPKVTLLSELDTPEKLKGLIVQGGFDGRVIPLGDVAEIEFGYEKTDEVTKVNGYEAVMFSVVKNSQYGIVEAIEATKKGTERFEKNNLTGTPIRMALLDDESIDVRNRLNLVSVNGAIGFLLILIALFIFLNKRSGFWVAMGLPFALCATMIFTSLIGYTINGVTLAAVIIVLGMVVDDAIVVAENISRLEHSGVHHKEAIVKGTSFVLLPIIASIVTTCVAFIPLFFFEGRHARFVGFLPPIIFMMLLASLFESIFILPGHMGLRIPFTKWIGGKEVESDQPTATGHWFDRVEEKYGDFIQRLLNRKWMVFLSFLLLLSTAFWIGATKIKFVMFPDEETRDLVLNGATEPGSTRYETAKKVREIEDIIIPYIGMEVVGFRTNVARSRRGSAVEDNKFRMTVEIVPREKRKKSADQLIEEFKVEIDKLEGFPQVKFQKSRWGQDSGSPIELLVQMNNEEKRSEIVARLVEGMKSLPYLENVEVEEPLNTIEYQINIDREKIKRLSINPVDVASTFRAALEGSVLYEFSNGEEDVHVRFTTIDSAKDDIQKVLNLPVENRGNYLVPLRNIVHVKEIVSPNSIARHDLKRSSVIFADIKKGSKKTPLEAADEMEETLFQSIFTSFPSAGLKFEGEVKDSRESKTDFRNATILTIFLIFVILAILFNSLIKPLIIMLAIPFGLVGIILAFYLHGKTLFGFYAAVGALGLAGVVINDSIIMLVKLESDFRKDIPKSKIYTEIANISKTRLRAVLLTTLTTVVGVLPTAYGFAGYDAMLAEMMLALSWGMIFGTLITLVLIPSVYCVEQEVRRWREK